MLSTRRYIVLVDADLEHRRSGISIVKSEIMEDLMQFLAILYCINAKTVVPLL